MDFQLKLLRKTLYVYNDNEEIKIATRKSIALLCYLASHPNQKISRVEIGHLLWDKSSDEQGRASLRQELTNIRKAFKKFKTSPIQIERETLSFNPPNGEIDFLKFEELAQSTDIKILEKAAELYEDTFMQGFSLQSIPFENWLIQQRRKYKRIALELHLKLLKFAEKTENQTAIEDIARKTIAIEPTCERAYRALMRVLYNMGRRKEALLQYQYCTETLLRELQTTPAKETSDLFSNIQMAAKTQNSLDAEAEDETTASSSPVIAANHSNIRRPSPYITPKNPPQSKPPKERMKKFTRFFKKHKWISFPIAGLMAGFLAILFIGGMQYWRDDNKFTPNNILCSIPKLDFEDHSPIKIGLITPFERAFGVRQLWSVQKFIEENRQKYPFEISLMIQNSKGDLNQLNSILSGFEREKVTAIIGPMQSRLAYDAKIWGNKYHVPILSPSASASYLVHPGEQDYFFRVGFSDTIRASAMVDWLNAKVLTNNPYVIHEWNPKRLSVDEPEIYGASQASAVKRFLNQSQTTKFLRHNKTSQLEAIKQIKNDDHAILIFGYSADIKYLVAQIQKRGIKNDIFVMGVAEETFKNTVLLYPEKIHAIIGAFSEPASHSNPQQLQRDFEDENPNVEYDQSAYFGYDAAEIILSAIEKARNETCTKRATGKTIAKYLRQTPSKKRKIITGGFLSDRQEIYLQSDGMKLVNGKFQRNGLNN